MRRRIGITNAIVKHDFAVLNDQGTANKLVIGQLLLKWLAFSRRRGTIQGHGQYFFF